MRISNIFHKENMERKEKLLKSVQTYLFGTFSSMEISFMKNSCNNMDGEELTIKDQCLVNDLESNSKYGMNTHTQR